LDRLLADIPLRLAALEHVQTHSLLVVAGQAHDRSRATIRSLVFHGRTPVNVDGHPRRYEITLRPLFFLSANGMGRLVTLIHELMHVGPQCDGSLDEGRRHGEGRVSFDGQALAYARRYARVAAPNVLAPLGHNGELLMRQWRIRPSAALTRTYGNTHLFLGPVLIRTARDERTVWW
jgi:hypothetical protein